MHSKVLFVEGDTEKRAIPELIEANGVQWKRGKEPVFIKSLNGKENLTSSLISAELKASKREAFGIILDADDNPDGTWKSLRNMCSKNIPHLPQKLPAEGLIQTTSEGIKFGIWIMPDNQLQGMLETFLAYLIPDPGELLWQYAQEVVKEAKNKQAPFKDFHIDKAQIYTWLAWQDEPGRQLHQAIQYHIFNPQHPQGKNFVNWFKTLYRL